MKSSAFPTVFFGVFAFTIVTPAFASRFPAVLSNAAAELRSSSTVPVFLPRVIPTIISQYGIKRVVVKQSSSGYNVSLYYSKQASDATYAGSISGFTGAVAPSSLPGVTPVRLSNGTSALFRPVSCGGSCAPANLWWRVGKFEYQLQLHLRSDLSKRHQQQALVEMANSMEALH